MKHIYLSFLIASSSLLLASPPVAPLEPVGPMPAYVHQATQATESSILGLRFLRGQQAELFAGADLEVGLKGEFQDAPLLHGLSGFDSALRMPPAKDVETLVTIEGALRLPARFRIDSVVRFAKSTDDFIELYGRDTALTFGLLDRDAGIFRVSYRQGGRVRAGLLTAAFESSGPLRRDNFQKISILCDQNGQFELRIDGLVCGTVQLDLPDSFFTSLNQGIRWGGMSGWKSRFIGELAELHLTAEVDPAAEPEVYAELAPNSIRYDFGPDGQKLEPGFEAAEDFGLPTVDHWFVGDRYAAKPQHVIRTKTRRALPWELRDAVSLPDEEGLQLELPEGRYALSLTLGHPLENQLVESVSANGQILGRDLLTFPERYAEPDYRSVYGEVDLQSAEPLSIRFKNQLGHSVSVHALELFPVGELPVLYQDGRLILHCEDAPVGFDQVVAHYEARQFSKAWEATALIEDTLIRNNLRAWIVGYPNLTRPQTLERLETIYNELMEHWLSQPEDGAAFGLLRMTYGLWHAAHAYQFQRNTALIFGAPKGRAWREAVNLSLQVPDWYPYYGHARLLAGNLLWQYGQQSGGYSSATEWTEPKAHKAYAPPPHIFEEVLERFPEASLPKVFLGAPLRAARETESRIYPPLVPHKVPAARVIETDPQAPDWAQLQHRVMVRLKDLIDYWISERMESDGTMGGGVGDDVEMMRWWKTAVLAMDHSAALEGWNRLASTVWRRLGKQPMSDREGDAEHIAEDYSDSHAMMPFLDYGSERAATYLQRSRRLLDILDGNIMAENPEGYLMFRSHHYSRKGPDSRDGDAPYNIRTLLPLLIHAYLEPDDAELVDYIIRYSDSWLDMTMREIDGKPAGITPMMILFDRSSIVLPSTGRKHDWVFPGYWSYNYPAGYTNKIYDLLAAAHVLTGESKYLEPHRIALSFLKEYGDRDAAAESRGSLPWAVAVNRAGLAKAGAIYRLMTGDRSYDAVLLRHGAAYTQSVIQMEQSSNKDQALAPVVEQLKAILEILDYNELLRTELLRSTDRVLVPGMDLIDSMFTGDISSSPPLTMRGDEDAWPYYGVTWKQTGSDLSVFIQENLSDRLSGRIYSFNDASRKIGMRIWRLSPGAYRFSLRQASGEKATIHVQSFELDHKGQLFYLEIPPRQECFIEFTPLP